MLELKDVDFVRDGKLLLSGVSLTVGEGERWALLGPNGAGKSTMLGLCGAVTHPTRGTVEILGKRLGTVDIRTLRESIGHVNPRHALRSPLSIVDVVLTGLTGTIERMPRWEPTPAQTARALELIDLLGVSNLAHSPWTTLSQGECGRALIARALIADPRLLLLDEPSTGLDVAAREQLLETLDHIHTTHPHLAWLLVTHHLEELPTCTTHATLIREGRILAAGPVDDVVTTPLISETFAHPIQINRHAGRWTATARRGTRSG
ncbi:iron complex transport system ATP-binding protein [Kribbella rubisoli]|uniref:Iron complex transport system ATP-binding protein n=1 Tax=Kribbella rubisoli TaxID=3075929 RepID=A0A4Q7X712_9ACTN|nr:ATP-binding cassette domain-containing protein [Kribbella rubisoli]RZU18867.1 iron complex transport system ATP-binding protein [Kribbella rubisoli]